MAQLVQVVNSQASIYALQGNQWQECGQGGQLMLYYYSNAPHDLLIRWWKAGQSLAYQLVHGKLKPKGERSWVVRAYNMSHTPPREEIIALRFHFEEASQVFCNHYKQVSSHVIMQKSKMPVGTSEINDDDTTSNNGGSGRDSGANIGKLSSGRTSSTPQPPPRLPSSGSNDSSGGPSSPSSPSNPRILIGGRNTDTSSTGSPIPPVSVLKSPPRRPLPHPQQPQLPPVPQQQQQPSHPQPSSESTQKWACLMCTYMNSITVPNCEVCNKPRPSSNSNLDGGSDNVDSDKSSKGWSCPACTFQNGILDTECTICGARKLGSTSVVEDAGKRPNPKPKESPPVPPPPIRNNERNNERNVERNVERKIERNIEEEAPQEGEGGGDFSIIQSMIAAENEKKARAQQERDKVTSVENLVKEKKEKERLQREKEREEQERKQRDEAEEARRRSGGSGDQLDADRKHSLSSSSGGGRPQMGRRTWRCPICTLMNDADASRCAACDTPRSSGGFGMMMIDHEDGVSSYNGDYEYQRDLMGNANTNNVAPKNNHIQPSPPSSSRSKNAMTSPTFSKQGSLKSLFEEDGNHNGEIRAPSKHVTNYNMVMQLSGAGKNAEGKKKVGDKDAFERSALDISCYNENPRLVFSTLRSVAKKLLKDDERYRTLDTTNPKVEERLIGYEGVIDFLMLLGFESDAMGQRLVCREKPDPEMVRVAIKVLDNHDNRFKVAKNVDSAVAVSVVENMDDNKEANPKAAAQRNQSVDVGKSGNPEGGAGGSVSAKDDNESDDLTLQQIVLLCTHEQQRDNETMETLIMCYKEFSTAEKLIKELKRRFFMSIPNDVKNDEKKLEEFKEKTMKPIQLNVVKNLRNWMKLYWEEDFSGDAKVQEVLEVWIKQMSADSKIYSWNGLLAETVRNEHKRYKKYGNKPRIQEKDYLSVEIPRRFNFHSLSPEELADQITLMDFRIFSRIKPRECMGQAWKKKDNRTNSPNILAMIQQFNNLTTFVQIQILREKSLKDRSRAVKRIIKMGEHFRFTRNYNSLCAVFSALNSAAVHRLKLAWEKVPDKQKQQFDQFKVIFSRDFNHRNLRQLFRNAAAPSIPHIGIFLQDLVFIDDGHENKKEVENLGRKMVNFSKSQRMADRIKNIQMYQQHPYTEVQEHEVVQRILIEEFAKLKDITEDQIWDMSTEIKKADERDKARIF